MATIALIDRVAVVSSAPKNHANDEDSMGSIARGKASLLMKQSFYAFAQHDFVMNIAMIQ